MVRLGTYAPMRSAIGSVAAGVSRTWVLGMGEDNHDVHTFVNAYVLTRVCTSWLDTHMTTTWEAISTDTYASADWRYVIEKRGDVWLVSERGQVVGSHYSLERAQGWVDGTVRIR